MAKNRTYIAIDLKSFYASVECRERGLDPLTTNLVVADKSRTEKTICLAVSPSLKTYGVPGRPRLFEVVQKVKEANARRRQKAPHYKFDGASYNDLELKANPALELDYIVAPPRMAYYMEYSTRIYNVYLKYVAPEDIHVYSIDEVFMDVTAYLNTYQMTARELTRKIIQDVLDTTGITATAGIGTNLYLCKIVVREMTDLLVLDLVDKGLVTDQIVLTIGYDIENLTDPGRSSRYKGEITTDHYGRKIPKHAHGTANLDRQTSSTMLIMNAVTELYDQIVDKNLLVRRITISANHIVDESSVTKKDSFEQLNLFVDYEEQQQKQAEEDAALEREKNMQKAMLSIKKKFGKNAILKGMNLEEGATAKDRNSQIGGHKA